MDKTRHPGPIHDLTPADIPTILPLNNAHANETSLLDEGSLRALLDLASYARGVDRGRTALLVALDHTTPYDNFNFNWLKARRDSFVYIDRVIVAASARGQGLAAALYRDLFAHALGRGYRRIVCEVNLSPPNPASDAFHQAMGFTAIGTAVLHNGAKMVQYYEKAIP